MNCPYCSNIIETNEQKCSWCDLDLKEYEEKGRKAFNIFKEKLYSGLSEDQEDFMLEQNLHYHEHPHEFYTSFYKTCVNMWSNLRDLSENQLKIIYREYEKVKEKRIKQEKELSNENAN